MRTMPGLEPIDLLAGVILIAATLRGLFNGMIREVFSVLALAAAVIAVRVWNDPLASWLYDFLEGRIGPTITPWLTGAALGILVVVAVGTFGVVMGRGVRLFGLGWADRGAGAALGFAEGVLVVSVILLLSASVVGRTHPFIASSRTLAMVEQLERVAGEVRGGVAPVDVAAPPPSR